MTTGPHVLNRHHFNGCPFPPGSLYVGRPGKLARQIFADHPEIGDGTALGNPYTFQQHGEAALDFYRRWLWEQIKRETSGRGRRARPDHRRHLARLLVRPQGRRR